MPENALLERCAHYMERGKPAKLGRLLHDDDFTIVDRLHWVMETSMLKTLAARHRSTVAVMARAHKATIDTAHGPRICFQTVVQRDAGRKPLVARFGGIPLIRKRTAVLTDRKPNRPSPATS